MHLRYPWRISRLPLKKRWLLSKLLMLQLWQSTPIALLRWSTEAWSITWAESLLLIEVLRQRLSVRLRRRVLVHKVLVLRRNLLRQARKGGIGREQGLEMITNVLGREHRLLLLLLLLVLKRRGWQWCRSC